MKGFVATSTAATPAEAGKEVAGKIAAGITDAKLAMAYGSCDYDSKALLEAVAANLPGVPVVGNTSFHRHRHARRLRGRRQAVRGHSGPGRR
jgi:hypothetical protein